jgi:hypothetical protein
LIFPLVFSVAAKLTGEFTSLEEPTDDPDIVIVLVLLADGSDFIRSERRVKPENPTQKLRLPIVNYISWFSSTSELLLAKSEKVVDRDTNTPAPHGWCQLIRVNSTNVLYEGLRIGGIVHQMNSKVKISRTTRVSIINVVVNLAYS